ncbi:MAG: hypothetical protein HDQ87_03610 [Clostridia bacterium]|nr:hypothetical protein [Clostridia bacterium]
MIRKIKTILSHCFPAGSGRSRRLQRAAARARRLQVHLKRQCAFRQAAERAVSSLPLPSRKLRGAAFLSALAAAFMPALPAQATAAQDPAGVVGRTVDFLLSMLTGVGVCFIAFGVLSLAISFQSHDDAQKSRAILAILGGAVAVSVRYVIQIVAPNAGITV